MTPSANPLLTWLSVLYCLALALLAGTILFRKQNKTLPRFTIYVLSLLAQEITLLVCAFSYSYFWYYWVYVITQPLCSVVLMSVLCEVFAEVFHPWRTLPSSSIPVLVFCGFLAMAIGFGLFSLVHPHPGGDGYMIMLDGIQGGCSIITAIGFGFVVLFSDYFGIPWRRHVYGVGVGALVGTLSDALVSFVPQHPAWAGINVCCWTIAISLWVWYFAHPDTPRLLLTHAEVQTLRAGSQEQMHLSQQAVNWSYEASKR